MPESSKLLPVVPPPSLPEENPTGVVMTMRRWGCPRCGSHDLAAGYVVDQGDEFHHVYLAPRRLKLSRLRNMLRPQRHLTKVDADVCRNCGMVILQINIQEFMDAEERFGRS